MAQYAVPTTEGKDGVPLRFPRPVMALIATGIAAVSIGLTAVPASADQVRHSEYWLRTLSVTGAWTGSKGSGITVAVLSDGVSASQPDLTGSVTAAPAPAGAPVAVGQYFGQQGTAIASLIAGHGHGPAGNSGVTGVAPRARILSVPVTLPADDPELSQATVAAAIPAAIATGIRYAVSHGATVIDLPIDPGQPDSAGVGGAAAAAGGSAAEKSAVGYALQHNVVLVAPAGDNGAGTGAPNYPAAYRGVIAVGAFNRAFDKATWSSRQSYVAVTAAGAGVIAASGSGYQTLNSTSAASAEVSGIVALIRARYPQLTVAEVRTALTTSTMYRRPGGLADGSGFGAVNADQALSAAGQLATSAAHRSGAGAQPWRLPSGGLAGSGTQSVGGQILQAGELSAAVLALLLLLVAGYVVAGRLRRASQPAVASVAPEWMHRQAQSRYPTASPADADPMLEFFSAPMARPERSPSQSARMSRSDPGVFAPAAGRQLTDGSPRPQLAPGTPRPGRGGWSGPASTADASPAIWSGSNAGHPGAAARANGAGSSNGAGSPGGLASRGGFAGGGGQPGGGLADAGGQSAAGGLARTSRPGPGHAGAGRHQSPAAGGADGGSGQSHGPASREVSRRPSVSGTPPWEPAAPPSSDLPWTAQPGRRPGGGPTKAPAPAPPAAEQAWLAAPADQPPAHAAAGYDRPGQPPGGGLTRPGQPLGGGEPARHSLPGQLAQPEWTPMQSGPDAAVPGGSGQGQPFDSADPAQLRTSDSGLPVRQPGANVPRPLSPSGSLWEPVETRRSEQSQDGLDPSGRPIYVWNPEAGGSQ